MMFRRDALGALWAVAALLAGCGTSPPVQLYQLPADPPQGVRAPAATAAAPVWELSSRVVMPGTLDRDVLLLVRGAEVQPLGGARWAEPLRDSVPRLLRQDLELLRGAGSMWMAPAPPGAAVVAQLRVEINAVQAEGSQLRLQARWWLAGSGIVPSPRQADLSVPLAGGADAAVAAYRLALWRLAERIAAGG